MNSFSGKIAHIGETEIVGKKNFKKRSIIIVEDPDAKYINEVKFQFTGEKVALADSFRVGEWVQLDFYVNGRRWHNPKTDKDVWFTELNIHEIRKGESVEAAATADDKGEAADYAIDDMPF